MSKTLMIAAMKKVVAKKNAVTTMKIFPVSDMFVPFALIKVHNCKSIVHFVCHSMGLTVTLKPPLW